MYHLINTDSSTFSEDHWRSFCDLLKMLHERYGSVHTLTSWEDLRDQQFRFQKDNPGYRRVVVFDGAKAIAWAEVNVRNPGTENTAAHVALDALFEKIPDAIIRPAADFMAKQLAAFRCDDAHMMSVDPRQITVARRLEAEELGVLNQYVLHRDRTEHDRIKAWLDRVPGENPDLHLEFFTEIPQEHVDAYAELLTYCLQAMPEQRAGGVSFHVSPEEIQQRNERMREGPTVLYSGIAFDSERSMAAMTFCYVSRKAPEEVHQYMTGVRESHRGRGLAKWLKSALFLKLAEDFPENERLVTWIRAINDPMLHINEQMGYVLEREGFEFNITRRQLEEYGQYGF